MLLCPVVSPGLSWVEGAVTIWTVVPVYREKERDRVAHFTLALKASSRRDHITSVHISLPNSSPREQEVNCTMNQEGEREYLLKSTSDYYTKVFPEQKV